MVAKPVSHPSLPSAEAGASVAEPPAPGGLFRRPLKPLIPRRQAAAEMPNRYVVREDEQGRYLTCLEAPEVKVRIDRGFSVTGSAARKFPEGTIFLDGVAQSEPFLDLERRIYNLDHHEGCVRPFTLAACEQALVLVLKGLDIRERPWTVYANEPDLDALVALWVLLNSMHLQESGSVVRRSVIPLVRLEGLIDSHGLEFREMCGFPDRLLEESFRRLELLREREIELKNGRQWSEGDALEHAAAVLHRLDREVYPEDFFEAFRGVEELAKVELAHNRVAVVCRSDCGIYELEKDLKRLYGKRLGVMVLQKDEKTYTLRQVDPFLPVNLEAAYRKLNVLDPAVEKGGAANRWGGSGEIGGSPRQTGTALGPVDLAEALRLAYRRPSWIERLGSVGLAVLYSSLAMLASWAAVAWGTPGLLAAPERLSAYPLRFAAAGLAVALVVLVAVAWRRRWRVFGMNLPEGRGWLLSAPAVLLAGLAGGVWSFPLGGFAALSPPDSLANQLVALFAWPLLAELVFRSIVHGVVARNFSIQYATGRWFVSWPVALSAVLYAAWTVPLWLAAGTPVEHLWAPGRWLLAPAALVAGAALGLARERSGSVPASLLLHYLSVAAAALAFYFVG